MAYGLALILGAVAALLVAVARHSRPAPRHEFVFAMVARLGSATEPVADRRDERAAA